MIKDLVKTLHKRRHQLAKTLQNNKHSLELCHQHQMYGAINELDMMIRTVQYQYAQWMELKKDVQDMSTQKEHEIDAEFNEHLQNMKESIFNREEDNSSFKDDFMR